MVMAQPWPAWVQTPKAPVPAAAFMSQSSRATMADLPPSSRNTFFTVSEAAAMIRLPTAVDPVKVIKSTRGSVVMASPMSLRPDVMTFSTPGGMSVCSATRRPRIRALDVQEPVHGFVVFHAIETHDLERTGRRRPRKRRAQHMDMVAH